MTRRALEGIAFVAAVALLFFLPQWISDFRASQLAYVALFLVALLGLGILTGFSGQISLGHGAFMAVGAYTTAILVSHHVMRDVWTIPLAGLLAGAVGYAVGLPALRLSGPYLALATFGIAVATPQVIRKWERLTNGDTGIGFDLPHARFGLDLSPNDWLYYLCWTVAAVLFLVAWILVGSRFGRTLRAVRDSEVAAVSSGISLPVWKTAAFAISAFYAGVAGALYALASLSYVSPGSYGVDLSIRLFVGVVVGGLGSLWGLVAGAAFIEFLPIYASSLLHALERLFHFAVNEKAQGVPSVVYGVVLILLMLALPGGAGQLLRAGGRLTSRLYNRS
jgi:branched-chain amino acid transport system permease protein